MPKPTFKKLPVEKQTKVLKAAIKEFSRVPLTESSVANIIKDAGIPRGSFYQYFEKIDDLFYYILEAHAKDIRKFLLSSLVETKGDIVTSFIELYKYALEKISKPSSEAYFRNIFLNMSYDLERMFTPNLEDNLNEVINLVDISKLNISSKLQLIYIIDIMEAIMLRNIVQSYKRNVSKEKNIEIFTKEIILVRDGIYGKTSI
jgi:AcrR family transcriptional regulator